MEIRLCKLSLVVNIMPKATESWLRTELNIGPEPNLVYFLFFINKVQTTNILSRILLVSLSGFTTQPNQCSPQNKVWKARKDNVLGICYLVYIRHVDTSPGSQSLSIVWNAFSPQIYESPSMGKIGRNSLSLNGIVHPYHWNTV